MYFTRQFKKQLKLNQTCYEAIRESYPFNGFTTGYRRAIYDGYFLPYSFGTRLECKRMENEWLKDMQKMVDDGLFDRDLLRQKHYHIYSDEWVSEMTMFISPTTLENKYARLAERNAISKIFSVLSSNPHIVNAAFKTGLLD